MFLESNSTSLFWQYAGSIVIYTVAIIGVIYGVFLYLKRNPSMVNQLNQRLQHPHGDTRTPNITMPQGQPTTPLMQNPVLTWLQNALSGQKKPPAQNTQASGTLTASQCLQLESTLALPDAKSLHTVVSGSQRFLIASTPYDIKLIAELNALPLEDEQTLTSPEPASQ